MAGVFLGTSEFAGTVLDILAASDQRPELVVTLPDRRRGRGRREQASPVADKAAALGIEVLKSGNVNEGEDLGRILEVGGEWASICAFGQLIKEPLLTELPMLNVHPSLLPRWRGAAPVERAIMEGDEVAGVTPKGSPVDSFVGLVPKDGNTVAIPKGGVEWAWNVGKKTYREILIELKNS